VPLDRDACWVESLSPARGHDDDAHPENLQQFVTLHDREAVPSGLGASKLGDDVGRDAPDGAARVRLGLLQFGRSRPVIRRSCSRSSSPSA
jgi:hypothetical protein